ncbi:Gtp-binding protein [Acidilobus saccharovorans 345-15]|uniref:Gtp-binding protein n=1 Tax=Acidilobus saccharovorans (strain DSM 16705 / JCM 18335 / VKM B-2471 / 345-15) TaxID=666510 RepID=D9Q2F0_ACIS3|nr:redox-regulated ATPase YchF [Acidilobus saccharovorans]ADL19488.1 Gtp-binding protein [Acidilobus saccharovorans 345-15]
MEPTNTLIGIVGKTNVGKSSFFSAATGIEVPIENRPFVTIEPNVGIGYARKKCVHVELGLPKCDASNSACIMGYRYIPVKLMDVAGLIPGAHEGKGLGNKFLDDLRRSDVFLLVVDASGSTTAEGVQVGPGAYDPVEEVKFVMFELDEWMYESIKSDWDKFTKLASVGALRDPVGAFSQRVSGFGITKAQVEAALEALKISDTELPKLGDDQLRELVVTLRKMTKPMVIVANKVDIPGSEKNVERLKQTFPDVPVVPTSALAELLLRKLSKQGLVEYLPGDSNFKVKGVLDQRTQRAVDMIRELFSRYGGTGVIQAINTALFDVLKLIATYPVEDFNKYTDKSGRVLPDVLLVPKGTTARELAYRIHTDLGETFLYAINAKTKQRVGADYRLNDDDVIKIVAAGAKG